MSIPRMIRAGQARCGFSAALPEAWREGLPSGWRAMAGQETGMSARPSWAGRAASSSLAAPPLQ
eukprot:15268721-Alexandrium_andersonii.AAC.1